jgi:LacI family transcriptional regulator
MARRPNQSVETTIFDVAKKAGVAISTVSMALRGEKGVAAETRAKILKAARHLHYEPNVSAQSLASKKTNLIAVCGHLFAETLQYNSYSANQMLMGVLARLKGTRFGIYVFDWSTHPDGHLNWIADISKRRFICGSVWLTSGLSPDDQKVLRQSPLPVVLAEALLPDIDSVIVENELGGYLGAQYLLQLKRQFWLITADPFSPAQKERINGVKKAFTDAGVPWESLVKHRADSYGFLEGERLAVELANAVHKNKGKSAISVFCLAGDWCALGILHGLKKQGIQIPTQVAVLGYDGMLDGGHSDPPLSTVDQPLFDMGFAAAGALLERIEEPTTPVKQIYLKPRLIVRGST